MADTRLESFKDYITSEPRSFQNFLNNSLDSAESERNLATEEETTATSHQDVSQLCEPPLPSTSCAGTGRSSREKQALGENLIAESQYSRQYWSHSWRVCIFVKFRELKFYFIYRFSIATEVLSKSLREH